MNNTLKNLIEDSSTTSDDSEGFIDDELKNSEDRRNGKFTRSEEEWIKTIQAEKPVISVEHPHWKGIKSSSNQLFEHHYNMMDNLTNQEIEHHAKVLMESGCKAIVLQGFPNSFEYLINHLNRVAPNLPIYLLYHGNFLHSSEEYSWQAFKSIVELARAKKIKKVGFVKKGMAETMANQGFRTGFIKNFYNVIPKSESSPLAEDNKIGIGVWSNGYAWMKPPFCMIAAASMLKNSRIYGSGFNQRAVDLCLLLDVDYDISFSPLPHKELLVKMGQMHVNLYVTLSECAPMLPLESLAMGVPCISGPNHHYFEDDEYLRNRLIVECPDKEWLIFKKLETALNERTKIINAYIEYAKRYNEEAKDSVKKFLEI